MRCCFTVRYQYGYSHEKYIKVRQSLFLGNRTNTPECIAHCNAIVRKNSKFLVKGC